MADGRLEEASGLALDESILTGEAEPVERARGGEVRSGSFAVEGAGAYTVTAVGTDSYAGRITGEAREFRHPRSPLERTLNRLLLVLVVVLLPLAVVLGFALWERDASLREAVTTAVAGAVTLVPEGLILLAALTYAVASARMARRGALAQQLNAVESLASVDVLCLDKTGTLTEPGLRLVGLEPAPGVCEDELRAALGRYAASSPSRNGTLEAIGAACPAEPEGVAEHVPFSSRRRWSGLELAGTHYVLGAPELFPLGELSTSVWRQSRAGRRVVALGTSSESLEGRERPPSALSLLGLVYLGETLRPEARSTVRFLQDEGIELKVISGDAPETVAAIARDAGLAVEHATDASDEGEPDLAATVIGRITPEGKRRFVERLHESGRYVGMVGDGVNDVPALKAARLAIAQGSGSQMARSVADVVLVRGDFAAVPAMVVEGRNILRNIQRVTKLFVAKSAFAAFLILSIGLTETEYPLLPRHLTLAATLTIGIPAFFLALAPSSGPWRSPALLREVARFAIPAGTAAGLGVLSSYLFSLNVVDLPLVEARTVATTVLVVVGLYLVLALEADGRRRGAAVSALCLLLLVLYFVLLAWDSSRSFFELAIPGAWGVIAAAGGVVLAVSGLALTDERFVPQLRRRFPSGR